MDKEAVSNGRVQGGCGLAMLGGTLLVVVLIGGSFHMLSTLGVGSIFQELSLSSPMKVFLSLYLFLGLSGATLALVGAYLLWKRYTRISLVSTAGGAVVAVATLAVPPVYSVALPPALTAGTVLSGLVIAVGAALTVHLPSAAKPRAPLLSTAEVANVAVFSAMYAIAILLVAIPSPTGGYTHIGDIVVFMAALLFGHKVGGLVGVLGAVVADLYTGYSRWFVSLLAHGLEGVVAGLARGRSLVIQVVLCVVGGVLMASTYFLINIFIKGLPLAVVSYARDLFAQAGVSIVVGIVLTNIVQRILPQLRK
jgi:uncharacterized membrane protein